METYILLGNYTKQGVENIKESPARIKDAIEATENAGGKWLGWWLTLGRYDFVVMIEAPNTEMVATTLLATGALGNVRTETLRAFTAAEFTKLVDGMP